MDLVKKNLTSIIFGVVALLGVILVFFPMGGWFDQLSTDMEKSVRQYSTLKNLKNQTFAMPVVDPNKSEAPNLEGFPNPQVIAKAADLVNQVKAQSQSISEEAAKLNRKDPLCPHALPRGDSGAALSQFKDQYHLAMDSLKKKLGATTPPTEVEIRKERDDRWTDWQNKIPKVNGQPQDLASWTDRFRTEVEAVLPDIMQLNRAKTNSMYVSENALDVHPAIPKRGTPDLPLLLDMWIAQVGYWIQEDLVNAIAETNAQFGEQDETGRVNVQGAVVKNLVKLTVEKNYLTVKNKVPMSQAASFAGASSPFGALAGGEPVAMVPPTKREYAYSSSGRVSNTMYDVVLFNMTVDADAENYHKFLAQLSKNRFITILDVDIAGVDRDRAQGAGFVYGSKPVLQLTIRGEAILFRDWTVRWMPEMVKKMLGVIEKPGSVANAR